MKKETYPRGLLIKKNKFCEFVNCNNNISPYKFVKYLLIYYKVDISKW